MKKPETTACCPPAEPMSPVPTNEDEANEHPKQLNEAGLIRGEVDGPRVCYCAEPGAIALFKALVEAL